MKKFVPFILMFVFVIACNADKTAIINKAYLGMSADDYARAFTTAYELQSSSSKITTRLAPAFHSNRLTSLTVLVDDISDYDTAYTVYELGNDLRDKYGLPYKNMETNWAGGTEKKTTWHKGKLEVEYSYRYNQVPGTSGLLYTGAAHIAYRERTDLK